SHQINGEQPAMPDAAAKQALATLGARYKNKSNVMYALQVEPHDVSWSQLRPVYEDMVDAIRSAAAPSSPIVMVSGTSWGRNISGAIADPVRRPNIVYKSHQYNSRAEFQRYFLDAHDAGLPVFIGEFGEAYGSSITMTMDDVNELLRVARERNIGWAAWIFDYKGPPVLLSDRNFTPTQPYGETIRQEMSTTPALPR
ncbi:MAG: hypothetical protein CYG59_11380, partial [Chloroflexi bacterium]